MAHPLYLFHRKLKTLNLAGNKFKEIPAALVDLNTLTTLNLDGNQFETLDEKNGFPPMSNLTFLSMSNMSSLVAIKARSMSNLGSLETVIIENCKNLVTLDDDTFRKEVNDILNLK